MKYVLNNSPGGMTCEPFSVMAKPVGARCNMRCAYCYYLDETQQNAEAGSAGHMTDETLERYVRQYIEASPGPVVQFTWHGGEPSLAGLNFYRRALELQKKYLPDGFECWNNLQTNGLLLNDEWCSFLAENRFDVGLSLDGAAWLHDEYRRDAAGRGTYERAAAAVQRLKEHGIRPDLLCTVTSSTATEPLTVYRAIRSLAAGWVQFIPIVRRTSDGGVTPDSVSAEGYGGFLRAVFSEWIYNDLGRLDVQLFAETALVWAGGTASLCWMAPVCGRVLIVERDGGVYSCDHFVDVKHRIGSIYDADLAELVDSPVQQRFGQDKRDRLPDKCRSCRWLEVCGGGCPKDRFIPTQNIEQPLNYLCGGLGSFFAHAEKPLKRLMTLRKAGLTPQAIMNKLRAEEQMRWKNTGRNDPCPCGSGLKAKRCCWDLKP